MRPSAAVFLCLISDLASHRSAFFLSEPVTASVQLLPSFDILVRTSVRVTAHLQCKQGRMTVSVAHTALEGGAVQSTVLVVRLATAAVKVLI